MNWLLNIVDLLLSSPVLCPQSVPSPREAGEPPQRVQSAPQVRCDHGADPHDADPPDSGPHDSGPLRPGPAAGPHEGAARAGWGHHAVHPRSAGLGGGEPAPGGWRGVGLRPAHRGVPAGQPPRPAPVRGGVPLQDREGEGWWGRNTNTYNNKHGGLLFSFMMRFWFNRLSFSSSLLNRLLLYIVCVGSY